jgi:hypothetical protein
VLEAFSVVWGNSTATATTAQSVVWGASVDETADAAFSDAGDDEQ